MSLRKLLLLSTVTVLACSRGATLEQGLMPAPYDAPTIVVDNLNWSDVDVYAVAGSQMYWLGIVTTNTKFEVEVPRVLVQSGGAFRLYVDPVGAKSGYVSDLIVANPGQRVRLYVSNVIRQSTYTIQ